MCKWAFIFLNLFLFSDGGHRKAGHFVYSVAFQDTLKDCEDFNNVVLDVSGLQMNYNGSFDTFLTGKVVISNTIGENRNSEIVVKLYKEEAIGPAFYYMHTGNLCDLIEDDMVTPYTALFFAMGVKSCPVEPKIYNVNAVKLNIDYAQDVMTHEQVGKYYIIIMIQKPGEGLDMMPEPISCHVMKLDVLESRLDEECRE